MGAPAYEEPAIEYDTYEDQDPSIPEYPHDEYPYDNGIGYDPAQSFGPYIPSWLGKETRTLKPALSRHHQPSSGFAIPPSHQRLTPPQPAGPPHHQLRPRIDKKPKGVLEKMNSTLQKLGRRAYSWNVSMLNKISNQFL